MNKELIKKVLLEKLEDAKLLNENRIQSLCPFHEENKPSFFVDLDLGLYHCFGCEAGGRIESLLKKLLQLSDIDLVKRFGIDLEEYFQHKKEKKEQEALLPVGDIGLSSFKEDSIVVRYLQKRNIKLEVAEYFDVRCGIGSKEWFGRVVFPIKKNDEIYGYVGRAVYSGPPRYYNSVGFKKRYFIYGIDKVENEAVIVEGIFDVLRLWSEDIPAIGIFGKYLSSFQLEALFKKKLKRIFIALDGDAFREALRLYKVLSNGLFDEVILLRLPEGTDPGDLGADVLKYSYNFKDYVNDLLGG